MRNPLAFDAAVNVDLAPDVWVDPEFVTFGIHHNPAEFVPQPVTIYNVGCTPLVVSEIWNDYPMIFQLPLHMHLPMTIDPGDHDSFLIAFFPPEYGLYVTYLYIRTDDPDEPIVEVQMDGLDTCPRQGDGHRGGNLGRDQDPVPVIQSAIRSAAPATSSSDTSTVQDGQASRPRPARASRPGRGRRPRGRRTGWGCPETFRRASRAAAKDSGRRVQKTRRKPSGAQALLEPGEVVALAARGLLVELGREVEAVDDPGVVALQLEEAHPGGVGLQGQRLFLRARS